MPSTPMTSLDCCKVLLCRCAWHWRSSLCRGATSAFLWISPQAALDGGIRARMRHRVFLFSRKEIVVFGTHTEFIVGPKHKINDVRFSITKDWTGLVLPSKKNLVFLPVLLTGSSFLIRVLQEEVSFWPHKKST
uniref:Uncharacterized protein n=1 Tax=Zea mays TaxID=4577 RepID=A0A804QA19_MAIZE